MNEKIAKNEEEINKLQKKFVNVEKYGTSRLSTPLKELTQRNKLFDENNKPPI